ncbi:hypothetical protein FB45DRAFT_918898 [Roridomyces roridus]|uniref:Uncharacterized protein n=1 Tax=Roridomyces roridus TaxID=1738132 RepID=A0AAD7FN70_9AGAR|nr:hypothetical protein FB45DRAFT_918898 [Roridomyces roridus]
MRNEDLLQLSTFIIATVVSLNSVGSDVVRYFALLVVFGFLARHCLAPIFPGTRIRALLRKLEETEEALGLPLYAALKDRHPHFVLQVELDLIAAKLLASHLQSDLLHAKRVPWKRYLPFLRGISLKAARCQLEVKELQIAIVLALESERQRRYNETIRDKRAVISSLVPLQGALVFEM